MPSVRFLRFFGAGLTTVLLGAGLSASSAPASADSGWVVPRPTNSAKIFRWGRAEVKDEFHGALSNRWAVNRPDLIRNQHGMLTLNGTEDSGTLVATLTGGTRQYGRWEARVRAKQYTSKYTPYKVVWELVPQGAERCGAKGIVVGEYTIGENVARTHVRNLPNYDYTGENHTPLANQEFHTFAIEVAPDHVSWFMDTKVLRTERRSPARTGASYDMRFRLVAQPGVKMNKGRMQMDWARYYTLQRKSAQSIEAPQLTQTTYAGAC